MTNKDLLETLGLSTPAQAVEVLHSLLLNNILTLQDIRQAITTTEHEPSSSNVLSNDTMKSSSSTANDITHPTTSNPTSPSPSPSPTDNPTDDICISNDEKHKSMNNNITSGRKYMERHVALRFHYDGASYSGLAQNMNCPKDNSVERVLFAALEKTCLIKSRKDCGYSRCGRTDKGVSAFGQVVALRVSSSFPVGASIQTNTQIDLQSKEVDETTFDESLQMLGESDLPRNSAERITCWVPPKPAKQKRNKKRDRKSSSILNDNSSKDKPKLIETTLGEKNFPQILNGVLPPTIRVLGWSPVSDDFSARFSASSRTYRYFFIRRGLDLDAMRKGLAYMIGRHDFRNLCKMNCEEVDNFERVIVDAKVVECAGPSNGMTAPNDGRDHQTMGHRQSCYFEIKGQAFLWHQIRCIASILFMIGKGYESPSVVQELLDIKKNPGKPSYPFANDLPLVLHWCGYNNLKFGHSVQNLWRVCCSLEEKWENLTLAAERIRNGLDSLQYEALVQKKDVDQFIDNAHSDQKRKGRKWQMPATKYHKAVENEKTDELDVLSWKDALLYIKRSTSLEPCPEGPKVPIHVPLMERSRGTTFEEKVNSILSGSVDKTNSVPSKRRRERYEENMVKKRSTREEDDQFYQNMLNQGGSGV